MKTEDEALRLIGDFFVVAYNLGRQHKSTDEALMQTLQRDFDVARMALFDALCDASQEVVK
jgi:hypothetical protein